MDANDSPMLKPVLLSLPFDVTKNVLPAVVPVPISTTLVEIPTPPVSCLRKSLPSYVFIASSPNGSCSSVGFLPGTADRLNLIMGSAIYTFGIYQKQAVSTALGYL